MEQGERQASQRLDLQIRFILEMDKLKTIIRRTYLLNADRAENTAEHSWHLAIMAMLLAEHANEPVNVSRVVKMVLIHDVVEIDAGDTYFYDTAAAADKADRERTAADRLFGMLPPDQAAEVRELWEEFAGRRAPEARFARALGRFLPHLHKYATQGGARNEHAITMDCDIDPMTSI